MNFLPAWNRKTVSRSARNRLRHSSSELAIELAEPRLLLSVSLGINQTAQAAAATAIAGALHTNLDNLSHVLGGIEQSASSFTHSLPLVSAAATAAGVTPTLSSLTDAASATHDKLFDLQKLFQNDVATPIDGINVSNAANTDDIRLAIQNALNSVTGNNAITVLDQSTSKLVSDGNGHMVEVVDKAIFDFQLNLPTTGLSTTFALDFKGLETSGLNLPVVHGTFSVSESVHLQTQYDVTNSVFTLNSAVATTNFNATASIPDNFKLGFGLLSVESTSAATLAYSGTIAATLTGVSATTLATDATANATTYANTVASFVDTQNSFNVTIPLDLSQDILAIPGFTDIAGTISATGNLFQDNWTFSFNGFGSVKDLAEMSPNDLLSVFSNVDNYINQLSQSSLLNIEFPFTNGATIGSVINFAAEFKADILDRLGSVDDAIGIIHTLQSVTATAANLDASVSIDPTAASLALLPESFQIDLNVDGRVVELDITNPFTDTLNGNVITHIATLDNLTQAINNVLPAALLAAGLATDAASVNESGGVLNFVAKATNSTSTDPNTFAAISIHTPGNSFVSLVTFAENVASLLGYGDVVNSALSVQNSLQSLFTGIGLHFIPGTSGTAGTLEFQLDYSKHLPAGLSVLGFDGSHRTATDTAGTLSVTASSLATPDVAGAFAFDLVINGHAVEVDVAADPTRTTLTALEGAIAAALHQTVNRADIGLALLVDGNNNPLPDAQQTLDLSSLIQVTIVNGALSFSALDTALTPAHTTTTPLLALSDVNALSFNVGFDLGDLGSLALTNSSFTFDATAGASMTVGLRIPSSGGGTGVDETTLLDSLPVWPTGAVTADQINNPAMVVRSDLGLGDDTGTGGTGLLASDVEALSDFVVASVTGTGAAAKLTFTASGISPLSGQSATLALQDGGATGSQHGLADLGFSIGQSGTGNQSIALTAGTALTVTPDNEFVFNLVVNGHAVKIDIPADSTHVRDLNGLAAAINAALGPKTGLPDMTVYLRDGTFGTIEFQSNKATGPNTAEQLVVMEPGNSTPVIIHGSAGGKVTVGDLELAIHDISPSLTVSFDPNSLTLKIVDSSHLFATPVTPETLGFAANQSAIAQKVAPPNANTDPSTLDYQAILTADQGVLARVNPNNPTADYVDHNAFMLTIGTLDPKLIEIPAQTAGQTALGYAAAINTALGLVSYTRAELGLSGSGTVPLSNLVVASVDSSGLLKLTLTMTNATSVVVNGHPEISVNSDNSVLRTEARFGLTIGEVDLEVWGTNGSHLASTLGIAGVEQAIVDGQKSGLFDKTRTPTTSGEITGAPLQGGTLADRIFLENALLYAGIHLEITGTLTGSLGFLGFSATADGNIYLSTSLSLQNPSGGSTITFQDISDAFTNGTVSDLWSFNIGSGKANTPWADLTVSNVAFTGSGDSTAANFISGLSAISTGASIDIKFDGDLSSLGDLLNTRPVVTYTGFSAPDLQNLSFTQIVSGIQTALQLLDNTAGTGVLTANIPLINVNLESILHFADSFANFVTELQNQPAAAIDQVSQAIQQALGTTAVKLALVTTNGEQDLMLNFDTTLLSASTTIPLNLDLKHLADVTGVSLPDGVADLASASGTLALTAGATIGISLGIRVSGGYATTDTPLANLNKNTGVSGNGTPAADLQFLLGNGTSFSVDIDGAVTVGDVIDRINDAAHTAGVPQNNTFASLSAGGGLVFTDTSTATTSVSTNLSGLGFDAASRVATASGNSLVIDGTGIPSNVNAEYAFNLLINGQSVTVDVPAATRVQSGATFDDMAHAMADAINAALSQITVDRFSFDLNGSGLVTLNHLVTATVDGSDHLKLTASIPDIASTAGPTSLAIQDINPAGLSSLTDPTHFTANASGTNGADLALSVPLHSTFDPTQAYSFAVEINGTSTPITIGAETNRTFAVLVTEINNALAAKSVHKADINLAGSGDVTLGPLITVTGASNNGVETLVFTAANSATSLAPVAGSPSLDLTQVTFTGQEIASDNAGLSTISTVLPGGTDYSQAYRFDVVLDGHAVTIDVPESGTRTSADSLTSAIKAALGSTLIDRSDLGLTGGGQVSVGQLVAVSLSGSTLTFAASDAKLGASHSFALQDSATVPQTLTLRVLDLTNSGLLDQLGVASDTGQAGLSVLGDPAHFTAHASGTNGVDLALSVPLPPAFDPSQAYTFDIDINGISTPITIDPAASRTVDGLVTAINDKLDNTTVHRADINLAGAGDVTLGVLVAATETSSNGVTTLVFTAAGSATSLAPVTGSPSLQLTHATFDQSNSGGNLSVTMTPVANADFTQAFAVNVLIDGHPITLSIGADAHRTDITAMDTAINTALSKISVDRAEFGLNGTGTTTLDKVLTATASDTQITLTGAASDLAPQGVTPSLAVQDIETAATDSGVATRTITGKGLSVEVDNDRFFIDTSAPVVGTSTTAPSGTGILVSVGVTATDLNFNTSFGPLSAGIKNGTATLGGLVDPTIEATALTVADPNGFKLGGPATVFVGLQGGQDGVTAHANQLAFSTIFDALDPQGTTTLTSLLHAETNVAISVDLPVYLIGVSIGDVLVDIGDILDTSVGGTSTYLHLPTDFASNFNAFNFLNQPQAIINGLDALLSTTDSLFQQQVFGFKLPLIGDALSSAGDFVGDLRANVVGYLQGLVDDYEALHPGQEPTTASIISDGLTSLLASLGFTAPGNPQVNPPPLVTSQIDPTAESITFDLNIEKQLFQGSVDLSANLGIPGLGIDVQNGKIDLGLTLDIDLQFGYIATGPNKGFFFDDTLAGSHALALSISATLPTVNPAKITADLGIVALSATNSTAYNGTTGTQLVGGVYVDLHPKTTADLFDLGFSGTSLGEALGTHVVTAQFAPTLDANDEIIFNINVNGTTFKVTTGVTASHSLADIETAIQTAMEGIDVAADLVGSNVAEKLSDLVTVGHNGTKLTFTGNGFGANDHLTVGDVHLSISDVPKSLRVDLTAGANLDLALNADIPLGGSIELPSVSTELVFEYQYAHLFTGFDDGTFTSGVKVPVTFEHVSLDVGHFLTDFLKPILDIAWDILGPIMPVLDFITSPLPGISDLIGSPTSLIQLAQLLGGDNPEVRSIIAAVQMIDEVATLIQTIEGMVSSPGGTLKIDFGTYVFGSGSSSDPTVHFLGGATVDPLSASGSIKSTKISSSLASVGGTQQGSNAAASTALGELGSLGQTTQGNGVLSLPILQNPISALKLLTGQLDGIDLITWELPVFTVGLSAGETFPVVGIPGVGISAGLNIDFSVSLHVKFGYDTTGLVEFLHSDNPVFLLDGFYVDDTVGPQLIAHFGISATASLDLLLVKAGITGEIDGDFSFTLLDPNDDGRVRPVEILDTLLHDPLHIFVIDGAITASVKAWWWVGIDAGFFTLTLYEGSETLISGTLVSFHYAPDPTPIVATLDSSGTLNLDMGPLANQRAHAGDNVDGNEHFDVNQDAASGKTIVTYTLNNTSYVQRFDTGSINAINADVGIGDNTLTMENVSKPIIINGGDGANTVNLSNSKNTVSGGTGIDTVNLGNGNNTVTGGDGVDTITVGDGNNNISGGAGNDIILAGAGANFVNGGLGDDTITVGSGRNAVIGGAGNNSIKTGDGNNIVFGGGADLATETKLSGISNDTRDTALSGLSFSLSGLGADENGVTDSIVPTAGAFDNVIRLGAGNNIVFGGLGGDSITAGSGNNVVVADVGTVVLQGGAASLVATTDEAGAALLAQGTTAGVTVLTGGGNDAVTLGVGVAQNTVTGNQAAAGYGDQIIVGGGGGDTLVGTNGTNIILGDFGSVDLTPSHSQWPIQTLTSNGTVGGNDTIVSGVGNDVLFGGPGDDTIKAGPGSDVIAGDDAKLIRGTAAIGPTATVKSFESLDENTGGITSLIAGNDVILDGSTGNDLIIAGGGNDGGNGTVDGQGVFGGSGNNVILGDFGIITPADGINPDVVGRSTGPDINGDNANGNDRISATNGYNVIMGGGGNDTINVGDGTNTVFGDSGSVTRLADANKNLVTIKAQVVDQDFGGFDNITSGRGSNVVIGGAGDDVIKAGGGNNILLGDFGTYTAATTVNNVTTPENVLGTDTDNPYSGNDTITVAGGNTVAMGGGNSSNVVNGVTMDTINANAPEALNDLLGTAIGDRVGTDPNSTGTLVISAQGNPTPDLTTRYTFEVVINGHDYAVDVGSDLGRTQLSDLTAAIKTALDKITLPTTDFVSGSSSITKLSDFVVVGIDNAGTHLVFTANEAKLSTITNLIPAATTPSFALRDAPSVNILFGDSGSVTRTAAQALISAETVGPTDGGADALNLNYGQNVAFGGAGADTIDINGSGVNVVLGDNGIVTAAVAASGNTAATPDIVLARNTAGNTNAIDTITIEQVATSNNIVMGEDGNDIIDIKGKGANVAFGDSGEVKREGGTLDFISAQTDDPTLDESIGGTDHITVYATATGNNVLIGGAGQDILDIVGSGKNVALGDVGSVVAATLSGDPDTVTAHMTANGLDVGDHDDITVELDATGDNILIGGGGGDTITIDGTGNNTAFGDGGVVTRAAGTLAPIKADSIEHNAPGGEDSHGGNDVITVGTTADHNNILIGGAGDDIITIEGDGQNIALGDLGTVTAATPPTLQNPTGTPDIVVAPNTHVGNIPAGVLVGGVDTISVTATASGDNIIMGGAYGDDAQALDATGTLVTGLSIAGTGNNIAFGDSGEVDRTAALVLISATTTDETIGASDTITITSTATGKNVALGGAATDTITIAGTGNNIALGDMGTVNAIDGIHPDVVGRDTDVSFGGAFDILNITAAATGNNIIMGETGDEQITSAGPGFNIIFGDTGEVTHDLAGQLVSVVSVDPSLGGVDTITTTAGSNIVFGGAQGDFITTSDLTDYIVGDNGAFTYLNGTRSELRSTDFTFGGDDIINAGGGENYVIGGTGNDRITGNAGPDVVIGDQGVINWDAAGALVKMSSLFDVNNTEGVDTIDVGEGNNNVIGGGKGDFITSGAGSDAIIGDNGSISFLNGLRTQMISTDFTIAGNDVITPGDGDNYVIGGGGNDSIVSGSGRDQLIGDQGFVTWNADGTRHEVSSLLDTVGTAGADDMHGGGGNDNIIGGNNADTLYGDGGNDIVIGDDGHVLFINDQERMAETLDQHSGTGDIISGGSGNNFLFGGEKNNFFFANPLADLIVIMDGHIDISANRTVTINIPPFFGDPLLSPLGKALQNAAPGDPGLVPLQFTVIQTGADAGGLTAVFGGGQDDGSSLIISTLSGEAKSSFDIQGLLSGNVTGTSLLNLLEIGPTSLIESVTVGDLDSQQDGTPAGSQTAEIDHSAIEGVLAQVGPGDQVPDAPAPYRPVLVEAMPSDTGHGFAASVEPAAAMVFDEERGVWISDVAAGAGPQLILNGADLPMLDLSGEMTMAA